MQHHLSVRRCCSKSRPACRPDALYTQQSREIPATTVANIDLAGVSAILKKFKKYITFLAWENVAIDEVAQQLVMARALKLVQQARF